MSIDVPDTLDLTALHGTGQQPGEELLPEVAPPPLMTPDVEVKGILGSHGNEEDDSLYSPLLCQSVISAVFLLPICSPLFPSFLFFCLFCFHGSLRCLFFKHNIIYLQKLTYGLVFVVYQFYFHIILLHVIFVITLQNSCSAKFYCKAK